MARVTTGPYTRQRRKKWLRQAKGYWGGRHRLYRTARLAVMKSMEYSYRDRKKKKGVMRALWITRINAALREVDISYSKFIGLLNKKGIEINRKILAYLALHEPEAFKKLVEEVRGG